MMSYFEQYDILSADQYGFRSKRSTVDAIALVVTEIQKSLKNRQETSICYLVLPFWIKKIEAN